MGRTVEPGARNKIYAPLTRGYVPPGHRHPGAANTATEKTPPANSAKKTARGAFPPLLALYPGLRNNRLPSASYGRYGLIAEGSSVGVIGKSQVSICAVALASSSRHLRNTPPFRRMVGPLNDSSDPRYAQSEPPPRFRKVGGGWEGVTSSTSRTPLRP